MKRLLACLTFIACTTGAVAAHAGISGDDFDLDTSNPPATAPASDNDGDTGVVLGGSERGNGDSANVRSPAGNRLTDDGAQVAPHKAHAHSWQSLLPGSIQ